MPIDKAYKWREEHGGEEGRRDDRELKDRFSKEGIDKLIEFYWINLK